MLRTGSFGKQAVRKGASAGGGAFVPFPAPLANLSKSVKKVLLREAEINMV